MADRIYLKDIVDKKRIRNKEKNFVEKELAMKLDKVEKRPSFYEALAKPGLSIIGEVKKASPSKGVIKECFEPLKIAKIYEEVVDAVSVLTEEDYFLGRDEYLKEISDNIMLPTLCKDFIVCREQILNAKILGASAVLLIVAILSDEELIEFIKLAEQIGLDALVEVHTKQELDRAVNTKARIIGINNRNLETFKTDLHTTIELRSYIPKGTIVVSESGILTQEDIIYLKAAKIDAILVGESFMRADDINAHGEALRNAYRD